MIDTKSILGLGPGLQAGLSGSVPPATQQQATAAEFCLSSLCAACSRLTQTHIHIYLDKLSNFRRLRTVLFKRIIRGTKITYSERSEKNKFQESKWSIPKISFIFCPFTLYFLICLKIWSKLSPENEATLDIIVIVFILKLFPILYEM